MSNLKVRWRATVLFTLGLLWFGPAPLSWAHSELISVVPAAGATVSTVPAQLVLSFTDPIAAQYVRVRVITKQGNATSTFTTTRNTVSVAIPNVGNGLYKVAYRVVSADGHPISGTTEFTVAGLVEQKKSTAGATDAVTAEPKTPATQATQRNPTSATDENIDNQVNTENPSSRWPLLLGAFVALLAAVGGAFVLGRRS